MCNQSCLSFGHDNLTPADIRSKAVLEVGSRNINGSLRPFVLLSSPWRRLPISVWTGWVAMGWMRFAKRDNSSSDSDPRP